MLQHYELTRKTTTISDSVKAWIPSNPLAGSRASHDQEAPLFMFHLKFHNAAAGCDEEFRYYDQLGRDSKDAGFEFGEVDLLKAEQRHANHGFPKGILAAECYEITDEVVKFKCFICGAHAMAAIMSRHRELVLRRYEKDNASLRSTESNLETLEREAKNRNDELARQLSELAVTHASCENVMATQNSEISALAIKLEQACNRERTAEKQADQCRKGRTTAQDSERTARSETSRLQREYATLQEQLSNADSKAEEAQAAVVSERAMSRARHFEMQAELSRQTDKIEDVVKLNTQLQHQLTNTLRAWRDRNHIDPDQLETIQRETILTENTDYDRDLALTLFAREAAIEDLTKTNSDLRANGEWLAQRFQQLTETTNQLLADQKTMRSHNQQIYDRLNHQHAVSLFLARQLVDTSGASASDIGSLTDFSLESRKVVASRIQQQNEALRPEDSKRRCSL